MTDHNPTYTVGEMLARQAQARREELAATRAEVAVRYPTKPASKQPTYEDLSRLQAQLDRATVALADGLRAGPLLHSEKLRLEQAKADARDRIIRTCADAPDPGTARGLANVIATDKDRPTRPATVGDMVAERAFSTKGRERYLANQVAIVETLEEFRAERDRDPVERAEANKQALIAQLEAVRAARAAQTEGDEDA